VLLHHHPRCKRPLVKVCDFGYSKHDTRSLAHSQVRARQQPTLGQWQGRWTLPGQLSCMTQQ
jgi:hypothetical protein